MQSLKKQFIVVLTCFILLTALLAGYVLVNKNSEEDTSLPANISGSHAGQVGSEKSGVVDSQAEISGADSTPGASENEESGDEPQDISVDVEYLNQNITSRYAVLYDVNNGKVLYARKGNDLCYPASLTKILTAAVALEYLDPDEIITVGSEIYLIGEGSSTANLSRGEKLYVSTLIDALMLPSGNDAAYVLALNTGKKVLNNQNATTNEYLKCFYDLMNDRAIEIGCTGTSFVNPDGYHDWDHYTTPLDLVKMSLYAMNFEMIVDSVNKRSAEYTIVSGETHKWTNSNKLFNMYEYATGFKTGTTNQSGPCLAATAEYEGRSYVAIIIGAESGTKRYEDVITLFDAVIKNND